jgi:hypothetical protein
VGIGIALVGALLWVASRFFPNLGELPGTIRIQGSGFTCLIPLLGSILLSVLLTIVLNLLARFIK